MVVMLGRIETLAAIWWVRYFVNFSELCIFHDQICIGFIVTFLPLAEGGNDNLTGLLALCIRAFVLFFRGSIFFNFFFSKIDRRSNRPESSYLRIIYQRPNPLESTSSSERMNERKKERKKKERMNLYLNLSDRRDYKVHQAKKLGCRSNLLEST